MDIIIKSWGDELRKLLHGEEETESNLGLEWNFPRLAKYRVTDEKKFFLAVMKYGIQWEADTGQEILFMTGMGEASNNLYQ